MAGLDEAVVSHTLREPATKPEASSLFFPRNGIRTPMPAQ
jgi:hypothetical protein